MDSLFLDKKGQNKNSCYLPEFSSFLSEWSEILSLTYILDKVRENKLLYFQWAETSVDCYRSRVSVFQDIVFIKTITFELGA